MDRISLTRRLRRQRRQEWLEWFNTVVGGVIFFVASLWMFMIKRQRDKPQIGYSSSIVNRSSILHRAQGNRAKDFVEVEEEVNIEDQEQHMHEEFDDVMATSHIQGGNANMPSEETSSERGRKRKRRVDPMADVFSSAVTKLGESLEKMANKLNKGIDREELDKKRSLITFEVSKMQSFTQSQKFTVISKIREDPERVNMFWDLPEADRKTFVKWILDE